MATDRAKNEGVRVIHEFVDQAVPDPATNIGVPKAMADSPSLDRFYKACCYRLEVGVRGDGFFDQPQVWVLIWAMVFKVGEFATGQLLKLFVEDLRRDLGYENTDDKLSGIEDRLDELNDRFRRQEGLMEEIYLEGKKLNREKLIAAMVAVGVKRGWDPDKAKKGAAEVVDQLLTDLAS